MSNRVEDERPSKRPRVSEPDLELPPAASSQVKPVAESSDDDEPEDMAYDEPYQARASDLYLDTVSLPPIEYCVSARNFI